MTLLKNKKYQVFWTKIISNGDSVAMNVNIIVVAIKMTDKGDMIRKKIQHLGGKNSRDNFGNISCCAICQTIYHWAES